MSLKERIQTELTAAMRSGDALRRDVLYNTYWIRFPRKGLTFETAIAHSEVLLAAARQAAVRDRRSRSR